MSEPTDREIRAQRRETQQQIDDALAQQRSEFEEKIKEKENETETQMAKFSAERSQMMEMMHALQQQLNNMNLNHHPQPQSQSISESALPETTSSRLLYLNLHKEDILRNKFKDTDDIVKCLDLFEIKCLEHELTQAEKIKMCKKLFIDELGKQFVAYGCDESNTWDWNTFKKAAIKAFNGYIDVKAVVDEFKTIKQRDTETVKEYLLRFKVGLKKYKIQLKRAKEMDESLNIDERELNSYDIRKLFLLNMRANDREYILKKDISDMSCIETEIEKMEKNRRLRVEFGIQKQTRVTRHETFVISERNGNERYTNQNRNERYSNSNQNRRNEMYQAGCFVCGDPKHLKRDCVIEPSKRNCKMCRRRGHVSGGCWTNPDSPHFRPGFKLRTHKNYKK
eukprot:1125214_1